VRSLSECSKGPERSRRILSPSDSLAEQAAGPEHRTEGLSATLSANRTGREV